MCRRPRARIDFGDHPRFDAGLDAPQRSIVGQSRGPFEGDDDVLGEAVGPDGEDVARQTDAGCREQLPRDGARGHACGGLTRARALENVTDVAAIVLGDPGEVRVTRSRTGHGGAVRAAGVLRRIRIEAHGVLPVGPVAILNRHGDRPANRLAAPHAGEDLGAVGLDRHPASASVAALASLQFVVDGVEVEREAGGDPFENDDERATVRFTRGEKSDHQGRFFQRS